MSHEISQNEYATELFDEEISARVCQIGDFSVRIAKCAYMRYPIIWDEREPVTAERLQELREKSISMQRAMDSPVCISTGFSFASLSDWVETVVSAGKHIGGKQDHPYQYICHAQEAWYGWCESIKWIGAVKMQGGEQQTDLLVHKVWFGSSHSSDYWCMLCENGDVKEYVF